jgi:hypothetical protein
MGNSMEFVSNHPVLSVALFIFIYLIISFEIKNLTKKYKSINCNDLFKKSMKEISSSLIQGKNLILKKVIFQMLLTMKYL